jgi:hypothetical protein
MRIGVIGAMQIEVDNLKASMSDISTKDTVALPMCAEPLEIRKWLQQCVESARCLPQSVRKQ